MIPMRSSSIFKSRWMALLWAAGIIWLAVRVAGPADSIGNHADVTGATISDDDLKKFADFAERR